MLVPTRWRSPAAGMLAAILTAALYSVGWQRPFSWDASNTVGHFVVTPSLLDPFRRQMAYNNHVLFSGIEHVVYNITGSSDERLLRVAPIVFAALAVGLLVAAVHRRMGWAAALSAGVCMATNGLALREFREVRGYGLLVLCAVVSALILRSGWATSPASAMISRRRWALGSCYGAVIAVAVATHLYGLLVLTIEGVAVCRNIVTLKRFIPVGVVAAAIGLAVSWIPVMDEIRRPSRRLFRPVFPLQVGYDLIGGRPLTFLLLLPVVVVGAGIAWRSPSLLHLHRAAFLTLAVVVILWVAAPAALATRFFIWVLPASAAAVAVAVRRRPVLVYFVLAVAATQVASDWSRLHQGQVPNRIAAEILRASRDAGLTGCAIRTTGTITLAAYYTGERVVRSPSDLDGCDVVVAAAANFDGDLNAAARQRFPTRFVLAAQEPGMVYFAGPAAVAAVQARLFPAIVDGPGVSPSTSLGWQHGARE